MIISATRPAANRDLLRHLTKGSDDDRPEVMADTLDAICRAVANVRRPVR